MNAIVTMTNGQAARITSAEIAYLVGKRHDNVKRTIDALKVAALERFASHEGQHNARNAAKLLGIRERLFTTWLIAHDWMYRDHGGRLCAKSGRLADGCLDTAPVEIRRSDYTETVSQPRITQKGPITAHGRGEKDRRPEHCDDLSEDRRWTTPRAVQARDAILWVSTEIDARVASVIAERNMGHAMWQPKCDSMRQLNQ
ncbi:MAG TPA: phage antirepressor KilAC domain-containing protein [Chiayiivirga sp.]|nr:phage antirepressor KilAC domain-containing protein [Chiayiivirga sp.]